MVAIHDPAPHFPRRSITPDSPRRHSVTLHFPTGRAAWIHTGKNAEGRMTIGGFGHYEDDLVKVDGEWLFTRRRIYNEGNEAWAAPPGNPAW